MNEVGLWGEIQIKPGMRAAAVNAAEFAFEKVRADDGARLYVLNGSDSNPDLLLFFELYRDQEALDAHNASDWLPDYQASMAPLLAGAPVMHIVRPLLGKGI